MMGFDLLSFFIIVFFVGGVSALIYWYAKYVGGGSPGAAFSDPNDRKKILYFSAVLIGVALVIFFGLVIIDVIKL